MPSARQYRSLPARISGRVGCQNQHDTAAGQMPARRKTAFRLSSSPPWACKEKDHKSQRGETNPRGIHRFLSAFREILSLGLRMGHLPQKRLFCGHAENSKSCIYQGLRVILGHGGGGGIDSASPHPFGAALRAVCVSRTAASIRTAFSSHRFSSASTSSTGGGGGIRTHGDLRHSGFQDRRIRPLCHPSLFTRQRKLSDSSAPAK